jgi:hypothetical protein
MRTSESSSECRSCLLHETKDPSAEATLIGGKFYSDIWVNSGQELAHEIIKKSEKDTHDAREEARRTEEVLSVKGA